MLQKVRLWFHKLGGKSVANDPFPPFLPLGSSEKPVAACNDQHNPLPARHECQSITYQPAVPADDKRGASGLLRSVSQSGPVPSHHHHPADHGAKAAHAQAAPHGKNEAASTSEHNFFTEYGESNRYSILEIIGKGSYGIVCSAVDNFTGEKVAIKKITNVFEHVSDATRILREVKLLRLLKHPDIVKIQHIMLPPNSRDYKDIYVVFELMETDLHQVIKANDDLTPEHHQFFLYQMLRGLKYLHSAKVFHRDLKPKNILANADCKLKICDFGLARPAFDNGSTMIFWTDYVATRWYRAPELCGSFFAKYSPSIDIWGVGCIFAEVLLGRPLFPGKNVVNQLEIITDLLGTPSEEVIAKVRNEKARRFLLNLPKKRGVSFAQVFPGVDSKALQLLRALLSFDPSDRPTAEQALQHPYFQGLHNPAREPTTIPVSKLAFEFDRRKLSVEEVRELIYMEILEYHPAALASHLSGNPKRNFSHPNALDNFKRMFIHLENNPGAVLPPGYQNKGRQAIASSASSKPAVAPSAQQCGPCADGAGVHAHGSHKGPAPPGAVGDSARDVAGADGPQRWCVGQDGEPGAAGVAETRSSNPRVAQPVAGQSMPVQYARAEAGPRYGVRAGANLDSRRSEELERDAGVGRAQRSTQGRREAEVHKVGASRDPRSDPGAAWQEQAGLGRHRMPAPSSSSGSSGGDGGDGSSAFSLGGGGGSDRGPALSLSPQQLHAAQEAAVAPDGGHLTASMGRHSLQLSRVDEMHACAPTSIPAPTLGSSQPMLHSQADAWLLGRHSLPGPVWGEQEARSLSSTFSSQLQGGGDSNRLSQVEALVGGTGQGGVIGDSRWEQERKAAAAVRKEGLGGGVDNALLRRRKDVGANAVHMPR